MRAGVTGGGGRLGNVLVRELLAAGYEVRVMEPCAEPSASLQSLNIEFMCGSVLDAALVEKFVGGLDVVFHLAAKIDLRPRKDPMMVPINVEGTRNVAAACKARGIRMVHCSSHHALDLQCLTEPLTEENQLALNHKCIYHRSKAVSETVVLEACKQGLDVVIVNPGTMIGPFDFEPSMIGKAMMDLVQGKVPMLMDVLSDYVDARDVALGMIAAAQKGRSGERYLLTGHVATMTEFTEIWGDVSGKKMPTLSLPLWVGWAMLPFASLVSRITGKDALFTADVLRASISNTIVSHEKAKRELGYSLRPLSDTLRDCLGWYRAQGWLH